MTSRPPGARCPHRYHRWTFAPRREIPAASGTRKDMASVIRAGFVNPHAYLRFGRSRSAATFRERPRGRPRRTARPADGLNRRTLLEALDDSPGGDSPNGRRPATTFLQRGSAASAGTILSMNNAWILRKCPVPDRPSTGGRTGPGMSHGDLDPCSVCGLRARSHNH